MPTAGGANARGASKTETNPATPPAAVIAANRTFLLRMPSLAFPGGAHRRCRQMSHWMPPETASQPNTGGRCLFPRARASIRPNRVGTCVRMPNRWFAEEDLRDAIERSYSYSWADALRHLHMTVTGRNHKTLKRYAELWKISTDHFDPNVGRRRAMARRGLPLEQVLVRGSTFSRSQLKRRLFAEGLKKRECELCGQGETWRGRRMALILDHINGVADDNRLENLQIVCPNCAATL